jgi:hypothetical protein
MSAVEAEVEIGADPHHAYPAVVEAELDLARYEAMPIEEVDATLRSAGIDPQATITAVNRLVREALQRSRRRS